MGSQHPYPNKTVTGTTASEYAAGCTLYNGAGAVFNISNLDASNNMNYKIDLYLSDDSSCVAHAIKAETSIAGGAAVLQTDTNIPFFKVVVSVIDGTGGSVAYQIDALQY